MAHTGPETHHASAQKEASPSTESDKPWHAMEADQVLTAFNSTKQGLSGENAQLRQQQYGPNKLPEVSPRGPLLRFLAQFHNVLIYALLVAGIVTAMLDHLVDSGVIMGVVLINTIIGFIQEGKAEDALRAIRQMLSAKSLVLRDGQRISIPAEELVPGDVVLLQSGDKVPADLRLFRLKGLQIQEAALTGESVAVEKAIEAVAAEAALGDRLCMAYSGTLVTYGQGAGVVTATGSKTEIGRISAMVAGVEQLTTPLLQQMDQFGRWLTAGILGLALFTFTFGVLVRDYSSSEMFLAAVGLAVAAIPEGLPAIMTITLAIGVQRMAGRNAIIRRLPAVETLGAVTVICSDKTGTLTRNEMTVRNIATVDNLYDISGIGYDPHGGFSSHGREVTLAKHPVLTKMLRASLLCNETALRHSDHSWQVHGDPMEGALMIAGLKSGLDPETEAALYPRDDIIPFESGHKFMATLHHSHEGKYFIFIKGAPERILERCSTQLSLEGEKPLDCDCWERRMQTMASKGQRLLAVAMRPAHGGRLDLEFEDVEKDLTMLGLYGLLDPPREEAIAAVARCREAGIQVKMITGDHADTATAIARQLKLANTDNALTGQALDALSDEALLDRVQKVDIYARVSPEHKLRLVTLLQKSGMIVSMTGDGVNDAPALKRADVGVAMGDKGTEAAKEAAEMVLADDNFASISHAVEEGRTVYDNLKKAILFILPTNGGEALVILGAVLLGFQELPLTPVQILWVNMITAVTLALALAFEPPEHGVMKRPPRDPVQPVLSHHFLWRIAYVSLVLMAGTFGLFVWEIEQGANIEVARTVAVNTLVCFEIFYLFNSRYITEPVLNRRGLFGSRYVLAAVAILVLFQLAFTYTGPLQTLFGTAAIGADVWLRILLVSSSVLFLVEGEKALVRRFQEKQVHQRVKL
ncbi:MAG: cation-transporting P-type ATPase [gamma proteobacterium endosymbiont of Lamellibrachia anaximandri]|nr:cation-transporting P-type ATPase [gamma proteobacterium endosymbiont of Lamellibrachia anaximandri]